MAVVENVLVGGVETGLYAVLHHLARPRGALQLLDLNTSVPKHLVESPQRAVRYTHNIRVSRGLSQWEFNHKLTELHKLHQHTLTL